MRTHQWLEQKLEKMLQSSFADLQIKNPIFVKFSRRTKRRLGSISLERVEGVAEKMSVITLNGHFRSEDVPEEIIDITLAHELIHYLHGFNSDHEQTHLYPHKGNVVNRELRRRGFSRALRFQKQWLTEHWPKLIDKGV